MRELLAQLPQVEAPPGVARIGLLVLSWPQPRLIWPDASLVTVTWPLIHFDRPRHQPPQQQPGQGERHMGIRRRQQVCARADRR